MLMERSRLGDESLDEGLEDRDKEDLGLVGGAAESSGWRTGLERSNQCLWIIYNPKFIIFFATFRFIKTCFDQSTLKMSVILLCIAL